MRGGLALGPRLLVGLELLGVGSFGGRVVPLDYGAATTQRRAAVNHWSLAATVFPWERGPFLRGGAGLAYAFEEFHAGARDESPSTHGFGLTGAAGWAFPVSGHLVVSAELAGAWGIYPGDPALPTRSAAWTALVGVEWQ